VSLGCFILLRVILLGAVESTFFMISIVLPSVIILSVLLFYCYADWCYTDCHWHEWCRANLSPLTLVLICALVLVSLPDLGPVP